MFQERLSECGWADKATVSSSSGKARQAYQQAVKTLAYCIQHDMQLIPAGNPNYPSQLHQLTSPPAILFTKGCSNTLLSKRLVSIIGCRQANPMSLQIARRVARYCAENQLLVLSGLAIGCDTEAHIGCLMEDGQTIAVLPTSCDAIYPKQNSYLAAQIIQKNGCLVSEYPPFTSLQKYHFLQRNRIIATLSAAVIIIESKATGGTHMTTLQAMKQKKPIGYIVRGEAPAHDFLTSSNCQAIHNRHDLELFLRRHLLN